MRGFGYIGNGSDVEEIKKLRQKVGEEKMIWTPGINISTGDGEMGQRYDPYDAIIAGSDYCREWYPPIRKPCRFCKNIC